MSQNTNHLPRNLKWQIIALRKAGLARHFRSFRVWAVRQPTLSQFIRTPEIAWLLCRPGFTVVTGAAFLLLIISSPAGTLYGFAALLFVWSIVNRFFAISLMTLFVAFVIPAIMATLDFAVRGAWVLLPLAAFLWVRFFAYAAPINVKVDEDTKKKLKALR